MDEVRAQALIASGVCGVCGVGHRRILNRSAACKLGATVQSILIQLIERVARDRTDRVRRVNSCSGTLQQAHSRSLESPGWITSS